jgi:hypothetical protein
LETKAMTIMGRFLCEERAMFNVPDVDDHAEDLRRDRVHRKWRESEQALHPLCDDPDHPGCDKCEEE